MRKLSVIIALFCVMAISAYAADTLLEGFEGGNTANWQTTSPDGQAANVQTHSFAIGENNPTEGIKAGRASFVWVTSPKTYSTNYYIDESGDAELFWADRINIGSYALLPSVPIPSKLRASVYNNASYTVKFAIYIRDNAGSGGLERGPLKDMAPGANTYEWDMATEPCKGFVTGDSVLDGTSSKLGGGLVYTETQPTGDLAIDMDNFIIVDSQGDLTPPAPPVLLSARQGSAPGKLLLDWAANTEPDLKEYKIYMATDANWGVPIINRLTFPSSPVKIVTAPATTTEIDVPGTSTVYIKLTAVDNATPVNNESISRHVLGARLKDDGSDPDDMVVLDLKRYAPENSYFTIHGYYHMIVYNAQALSAHERYFESCMSEAIVNETVSLAAESDKILIWSCALDGVGGTVNSVHTGAIQKITDYVSDGGKLMISGNAIGNDMDANGNTEQKAFYHDVLKAILSNANAEKEEIISSGASGAPFVNLPTFYTGPNIYNLAAYASTNNEAITPLGSTGVRQYPEIASGNAIVYSNNKVVYMGFGFESVRHSTGGSTFAQAAEIRKDLLGEAIDYFFAPPPSAADNFWNLYE
ncbi:hypothetical protein JW926_17240 [Candidatus Sumerlaeota bacterium]|nr:hypothetical protein [Candidatus Sumerlaeota bacterium]